MFRLRTGRYVFGTSHIVDNIHAACFTVQYLIYAPLFVNVILYIFVFCLSQSSIMDSALLPISDDPKGDWAKVRWDASLAPYTAINNILRMYYDSNNASRVLGNTRVYDSSVIDPQVNHFIGIKFVAAYIMNLRNADIPFDAFRLLSIHLNHPCNLYRVNATFNQNIGLLPVEAFVNSSDRHELVKSYVDCKVERQRLGGDEKMYGKTSAVFGTVGDNVQFLLDKMEAAEGPYADLTVAVGHAFKEYLSLKKYRDKPAVYETARIGGFVEKGLR